MLTRDDSDDKKDGTCIAVSTTCQETGEVQSYRKKVLNDGFKTTIISFQTHKTAS
jgi:hypothetical protein